MRSLFLMAPDCAVKSVLAPHARWRSQVVSYGRPNPESNPRQFDASPRAAGTPGAGTWAALMRRVFDFDVLPCPRCGGRPRVLATVHDPLAVQALLASLARPGAPGDAFGEISVRLPHGKVCATNKKRRG